MGATAVGVGWFAADRLRKNPLGVYVNAINWSRELGQ
jgi:type IV secretory pathway TrbF-like protein